MIITKIKGAIKIHSLKIAFISVVKKIFLLRYCELGPLMSVLMLMHLHSTFFCCQWGIVGFISNFSVWCQDTI